MQNVMIERTPYGWAVWFFNVPKMPDDVEIPLPFTYDAPLWMVAADMRKRFPKATLRFRNRDGVPEILTLRDDINCQQ